MKYLLFILLLTGCATYQYEPSQEQKEGAFLQHIFDICLDLIPDCMKLKNDEGECNSYATRCVYHGTVFMDEYYKLKKESLER